MNLRRSKGDKLKTGKGRGKCYNDFNKNITKITKEDSRGVRTHEPVEEDTREEA